MSLSCMLHSLLLYPWSFKDIWLGVQIMKLLIMQCARTSCYFIPRGSKYSPRQPDLKHPQSVFSLCVRDQVLGDLPKWWATFLHDGISAQQSFVNRLVTVITLLYGLADESKSIVMKQFIARQRVAKHIF
jgi:hypothetical protein